MADVAPKSGEFLEGKLWFTRKSSVITVGLTNSGIEEIGAVESIEFPSEGDDFDKGDVVATVEGTKGSFEVTAPAAGVVHEINEAAKAEPEMISEDPLEEGWLIKLEIQDASDLKEYAIDEG